MQAFAKIAAGNAALLLSGARAADMAHGLDNNWLVRVQAMKDSADCMKITSALAITDLGMNLEHNATEDVQCAGQAGAACSDNYDCDAIAASSSFRPAAFEGCTFDESSGVEATVEGIIMDGLCHNNFIVNQFAFNGAPGLAPDKVYVRTMADLHTRACLIVKYCSKTGYYLVAKPSGEVNYAKVGRFDSMSAEWVWDWLIAARHPECDVKTHTTTSTTVKSDADGAVGYGGMPLALGLGTVAAALAA